MKELIFCLILATSLYTVKEPYKPRAKELCSRPNVITKPEKVKGKIFERPIHLYELPRYRFKTGFPLTNNDYLIIRL